MARLWDATGEVIDIGSDALLDNMGPASASCWFYVVNASPGSSDQCALVAKGSGLKTLLIWLDWTSNALRPAFRRSTNGGHVITTGSTNANDANVWHQISSSWQGTPGGAGADMYYDGVIESHITQDVGGGTGNDDAAYTMEIGAINTTVGTEFKGGLAEVAIWNVELTAAEHAILGKGYSPLFVRPSGLVAYLPLIGRSSPEPEFINGFNGTVTGASVIPHPRIIYPARPTVRAVTAAAGGLSIPIAAYHYNHHLGTMAG